MDAGTIDDAATEAHWAAVAHLKKALGRDPSHAEIACALAKAFGDGLAIVGASTSSADLLRNINGLAQDAYQETLVAIGAHCCGGLV